MSWWGQNQYGSNIGVRCQWRNSWRIYQVGDPQASAYLPPTQWSDSSSSSVHKHPQAFNFIPGQSLYAALSFLSGFYWFPQFPFFILTLLFFQTNRTVSDSSAAATPPVGYCLPTFYLSSPYLSQQMLRPRRNSPPPLCLSSSLPLSPSLSLSLIALSLSLSLSPSSTCSRLRIISK